MAKGKPTPASFKPGDARAIAAGRKSSRALPVDLKDARALNATLFENTIYKYMGMPVAELEVLLKDKSITARDMVVIRILALALQNGDTARLEFLLQRTIGKVADRLDVRAAVATGSLHDQIMMEIENGNK
jgi:hypothetical protein